MPEAAVDQALMDLMREVNWRQIARDDAQVIVLTVPTGATDESCLPPGRHHFIVESGRVVDSRY